MKKRIAILTGAGMSAESGIQTFRDANGLWEGHNVMEVASPEGFSKNPELVLNFYNQRRKQLLTVQPNEGHFNLKKLEENFIVNIITQNVDDLHERAGSKNVIHLHGELLKVRSSLHENSIYNWNSDLLLGDTCKQGTQLRPHIVWFGEMVPMLDKAIEIIQKADILVIIGTSMQVYPTASLINYAQPHIPIYFIDPAPAVSYQDFHNLTVIQNIASSGTEILLKKLIG
ncbi:SIR2 family NAD-dependent protein deacylase [Tenacibaculum maritimum]|uniref:SIR2 family NAD-dependent protein deacylase n=1 Tax=Tenacibaculum maritimum TaxID=107401 RepID=UPI0038762C9F